MVALGASENEITAYKAQLERDDIFLVLPENWDAVMLFNRSQTQWLISHQGHLSGLNYINVDVILNRMHTDNPDQVFEQMQTLEIAYLNSVNQR